MHGGEEMISFPRHTARFVKLEILSTVGAASGRPERRGDPFLLSEFTLFE